MPSDSMGAQSGIDAIRADQSAASTMRTTSRAVRQTFDREITRFSTPMLLAELGDSVHEESEHSSSEMLREGLEMLVRLIERVAPGMRGSVLLLDDDGVTLRSGAAPNLPASYSRAIDGAQIGPAAGSCGTAAYRGQRVIVADIATDPLWAGYRHLAAAAGLAACWSTPIIDADGRVLGTFAMYYDERREPTAADLSLTETATLLAKNVIKRARSAAALRRRTESAERLALALQLSEARFRQMAETIPVQVWTAQPNGLLDFVTARTASLLGRPAHELLGEGWAKLVHPDDVERAAARWAHSVETGESYEVEFRLRSRDESYRWHLVRAEALRGDDGEIAEWFGCTAEIEEIKRLQTALDVALAQARDANKSKAEFLATMSHELRTPLNAIAGYAQLMLDGIPTPPSEGQLNYLRRIVKSQQHLLGLIESVLTHAKLEAGKVTYDITDVVAHEILSVVDPLTAPQRAAKRISYDCTYCDQKLRFRGDKQKVVQILLNVLSNAAKFTATDGRIRMETAMLSRSMCAFIVTDTGLGMSEDELAVVFEPFVQFDNSLSRENKGTGLGMPISRELARGMGGDLVATSMPGVGSSFTLSLPLAT